MAATNRPLRWAAVLWLGVFTLCWLLGQFLPADDAFMVGLLTFLPLGLTGVGLGLWGIAALGAGPDRKTPALTLASLAAVVVFVGNGGCARHPQFDRADYDARIARIRAAAPGDRVSVAQSVGGNLDTTDPSVVRVAFPEPGGMLDNYTALVYDPTGLVMKANDVGPHDLHDAKHAAYVKLFGGDMISARPLGGGWYRCGFT